jgi:hypothetical protein
MRTVQPTGNSGDEHLGHFVVEVGPPRRGHHDVAELADQARAAAAASDPAHRVRFVRAVAVPEDGWCLLLFVARSKADVQTAMRSGGIGFARLSRPMEAAAAPGSSLADLLPAQSGTREMEVTQCEELGN